MSKSEMLYQCPKALDKTCSYICKTHGIPHKKQNTRDFVCDPADGSPCPPCLPVSEGSNAPVKEDGVDERNNIAEQLGAIKERVKIAIEMLEGTKDIYRIHSWHIDRVIDALKVKK